MSSVHSVAGKSLNTEVAEALRGLRVEAREALRPQRLSLGQFAVAAQGFTFDGKFV